MALLNTWDDAIRFLGVVPKTNTERGVPPNLPKLADDVAQSEFVDLLFQQNNKSYKAAMAQYNKIREQSGEAIMKNEITVPRSLSDIKSKAKKALRKAQAAEASAAKADAAEAGVAEEAEEADPPETHKTWAQEVEDKVDFMFSLVGIEPGSRPG